MKKSLRLKDTRNEVIDPTIYSAIFHITRNLWPVDKQDSQVGLLFISGKWYFLISCHFRKYSLPRKPTAFFMTDLHSTLEWLQFIPPLCRTCKFPDVYWKGQQSLINRCTSHRCFNEKYCYWMREIWMRHLASFVVFISSYLYKCWSSKWYMKCWPLLNQYNCIMWPTLPPPQP